MKEPEAYTLPLALALLAFWAGFRRYPRLFAFLLVVPFNQRVILQLAIVTSLPCLPLMLLVVPMGEVFFLVTKAVF